MCHGVREASRICMQPLLQGSLVSPRQVLPSVIPSGRKIHIWRLSLLAAHHQRHIKRLASLVDEGASNSEQTLVACSVVGHQHTDSATSTNVANVLFSSTGVNHALHRQFNAGKTLKGILKGCAEQNALGVAAASGHRYSAITDVYLYALSASPLYPYHDKNGKHSYAIQGRQPVDGDRGANAILSVKGAVFPCPECWRNLSAVAAMRRIGGKIQPLSLFVHAHDEIAAMHSVSVARDCLAVIPTPAIDVTIVLPG